MAGGREGWREGEAGGKGEREGGSQTDMMHACMGLEKRPTYVLVLVFSRFAGSSVMLWWMAVTPVDVWMNQVG